MKLTREQSEMLYEIAEIHLDWIFKYNKNSDSTFKEILKINHNKLLKCFDDKRYNEKNITEKLIEMRAHVLRLKDDF